MNGRVAALLELGSGFHQDLTGAENIDLNASLLGLSRKKTEACFDEIVEFSGIGDFIYEPLRTYSSGMTMRLAFSVAVHVDPDILIVDEVLAVGDQAFQTKCFDRIAEFKRAGKTLLFVSHSPQLVKRFCDRTLWLDHGEAVLIGTPDEVLDAYAGKSLSFLAGSSRPLQRFAAPDRGEHPLRRRLSREMVERAPLVPLGCR